MRKGGVNAWSSGDDSIFLNRLYDHVIPHFKGMMIQMTKTYLIQNSHHPNQMTAKNFSHVIPHFKDELRQR